MWYAKEALKKGFRWIVGDCNDIVAVQDHWPRKKQEYCVKNIHIYEEV